MKINWLIYVKFDVKLLYSHSESWFEKEEIIQMNFEILKIYGHKALYSLFIIRLVLLYEDFINWL